MTRYKYFVTQFSGISTVLGQLFYVTPYILTQKSVLSTPYVFACCFSLNAFEGNYRLFLFILHHSSLPNMETDLTLNGRDNITQNRRSLPG